MNSTLKSISGLLVVVVFVFVGYYVFSQKDNLEYAVDSTSDLKLEETQRFIEKNTKILNSISIDKSVFENPIFASYRSFYNPYPERTYNYSRNPFVESQQTSNF